MTILRPFPYPGNKRHTLDLIRIPKRMHSWELFGGSATWSYNRELGRNAVSYVSEINPSVIALHLAFTLPWTKFNRIQSRIHGRHDMRTREGYYAYRNQFNADWEAYRKTLDPNLPLPHDLAEYGARLLPIVASCIQGFLRWGPHGFNAACGLRKTIFDEATYLRVHARASRIQFLHGDYYGYEATGGDPTSMVLLLDPPYLANPNGLYDKLWDTHKLRSMLKWLLTTPHPWIYADTENPQLNKFIRRNRLPFLIAREQPNNAPGAPKGSGRKELIVASDPTLLRM